tara:strand:+ start:381 stop:1355 length:975 start_codon:yes stop_codon:yes gene_type:complete
MNVQTHNLVRGDTSTTIEKLQKRGIHGAVVNADRRGKHVVYHPNDIEPIDPQRDTYISFVEKGLMNQNGFDYMAATVIDVIKTPEGKLKCWNGIGRLAMAQVQGLDEIDVWLTEGSEKDASYYFVYNQDEGARKLSPEIKFANKVFYDDPDAVKLLRKIDKAGLCIRTNKELDAVLPAGSKNPEITLSAMTKALKFANGNIATLEMARDLIVNAWSNTRKWSNVIRSDLFVGTVILLDTYDSLRRPGAPFDQLQNFFCHKAFELDQPKLKFKHIGGNQHNAEGESVAYGILKTFTGSNFCTNETAKFVRHTTLIKRYDLTEVRV